MHEFNAVLFKKCVWYYAKRQSIITPITWEEIIGRCTNSKWIPGDHFMADVVNPEYLSNVKSLKKKFNKSDKQSLSYVQCRAPITNDTVISSEQLGKEILDILEKKKQESFEQFSCNVMKDFLVQHYRVDDTYYARVFVCDHPDFKSYDLVWEDGKAKLPNQKSWFIKRDYSDANHGQNCTHIKKVFTTDLLIADVVVDCPDEHNVSNTVIIEEYEKFFCSEQPLLNLSTRHPLSSD